MTNEPANTTTVKKNDSVTLDNLLSSATLIERPVLAPVLVVVGTRCAGKDTELTKLRQLRLEDATRYGDYFKVQYLVPTGQRSERIDEEISRESGAIERTVEELAARTDYLFCYRRGETFYGFVNDEINKPGIPMIHIADVSGLDALKKTQRIPNHLLVFINVNGSSSLTKEKQQHVADIRERALTRLVREYDLSREDFLARYGDLLDTDVKKILDTNKRFMHRRKEYDAIYDNRDPGEEGIRAIIYPNARESVIEDIAYRINELFHRYVDALKGNTQRPISTSVLHHSYVRDVCQKIFGKDLSGLTPHSPLADQLHRYVRDYAEIISSTTVLNQEILSQYLSGTYVTSITKDKSSGVYTVKLCPQRENPLNLQTLKDQGSATPHADYHILRIIAYALFKKGENFRARPKYIVEHNEIKGITYSLSDQKPKKDSNKQRYYRIKLLFDY